MNKTLQRVILLALMTAFTSAAFWPWQNEDVIKKPKGDSDYGYDVEADDANVKIGGKDSGVNMFGQKKKSKKTPNAEKLKLRRKFQMTQTEKLLTEDVRAAIAYDIWDDTIGAEDADGISDASITKLWQEHMHDFVPEDMFNFLLADGLHTVLYETIGHSSATTIKGAYYVKGGNANKQVSVIVLDPLKNVVYKRARAPQHIIIFDSTVAGEYSFIYGNFESRQELTVTMALHTYEVRKEEPIEYDLDDAGNRIIRGSNKEPAPFAEEIVEVSQPTDIDPEDLADPTMYDENGIAKAATGEDISVVRSIMRNTQTSIKQIQTEAKLSLMRQQSHNEDLLENTNWSIFSILIEVSLFIGILAFQLHNIKRSLDNKLIL